MQNAGMQFVVGEAVNLGDEKLHSAHAQIRQDGDTENDDGQTAKPLCHTAPKEDVFRNSFDVGEDGGTRGGEPGECLEETIGEIGHTLAEQEGHSAEERQHEPGNADNEDAVARSGLIVFVVAGSDEEDKTRQ